MSHPTVRAAIAALCLCAAALEAYAQPAAPVPVASTSRLIRVDGVFAPADGLAPAAVELVTLTLYASASDASPLWQETQEVRVDAAGHYAVFLGATAADGLPVSLFASGEPRWLGLAFARPGEQEQARMLMTGVPYALRAADADTLGGLPPSAFIRADGAHDGSPAPGAEGAESSGAHTAGPMVNAGTANYLGKFTNTVDLGNSVLFENAGKVGLGTTTPLDFLHSRFTNSDGTVTGLAVQNLGSSSASYSGMLFYDQNGGLAQFQGFNNATHEYRINNVADVGSINFMLKSVPKFQVRSDGDIDIAGSVRRGGVLFLHERGSLSVGVGSTALSAANPGAQNVAVGYGALNTYTGSGSVAIGWAAGASKVSGDYNIYIGAGVGFGSGAEANTTRIGDSTNTQHVYLGGVRGVTTPASNAVTVMVDSNGHLGTINSSRRYKRDIQDMGDASSGLMRLRPVTYRYEQAYADGSTPVDYGLIAEEVDQVYPNLVAHLANGEIETVQYHKINAMLLNEVQKQHRQIEDQRAELNALATRLAAMERLLTATVK